ncbi:MAG: hypothetical protein ACYDDO_13810 [Acidiferrobacterales bacterium]
MSDLSAAEISSTEVSSPNLEPIRRRRGVPSVKVVGHAVDWILAQERLGLFTSIPLVPGNEFPTLVGRLPLCPPMSRARQKKKLDADNALPFTTSFGRGRRFGAPTTTDDEDVLFAMLHLRTHRLTGPGNVLPIKISSVFGHDARGRLGVHTAIFTLGQLVDELGISKTGPNYRSTMASVKRLNAMVVELETAKKERYFGKDVTSSRGTSFKLLDVAWELFDDSGVVYVQFSPVVVMWLENEYTYVNWNVRKKLHGQNARALHRFLSTQPHTYRFELVKVADAVGIDVPVKKLKPTFNAALKQMKDISWLSDFGITGTGRASPLMLWTSRAPTEK